ncbi:MAG: double-strand break repair helicase AddA [Donghicola sp.]|jgi:ATP-dependent helicase/nuclease subunit A|nr:double-strand break repair helicase AddA [Donghicola sp.]MCT4576758.1 double-strand break repair helicase AddA [Donghicola sp.]
MNVMNDATARQVQAANPHYSTWLAANAGSGKTRVLTDRVARLLLTGVEPQHILCLTYTKAAASEMQNRLFKRLGEWAMLDAASLQQQLEELGEAGEINAERLAHARTLFARAIETPGGLKIQTIHSFCGGLLRRFPLEAGVSPGFSEMEERASEILRIDVLEQMSEQVPDLLARVADHLDESMLGGFTASVVSHLDRLRDHPGQDAIWQTFDLPSGYTESDLRAHAFIGGETELIGELVPLLLGSGANDSKAGAKLQGFHVDNADAFDVLENMLLTGAGAKEPFTAKIDAFPTKALRSNGAAHLMDRLNALMLRIEDTRARRLSLLAARKSLILHDFAADFLRRYESAKQLRGALDFDDLIRKARMLLTDPAVAQWVLYRLDGGIDHILVDEAQDTSPQQWAVIEALAQEFTSGEGARSDVERTIFVVGDKKQSIYSFQGADPEAFDRMQDEFRGKLETVGALFQSLELEYSFRSSVAVLGSVDKVFKGPLSKQVGQDATHRAFKSALPGRVDLWPFYEADKDKEDDTPWYDPVDRTSASSPEILLARDVAREIRRMVDDKVLLPDEAKGTTGLRPVRPGDFLILVQKRAGALFSELIRACKAEGLPIAGADRLKVGAELAVRDLGALLAFLALPEDDLALATALRSPLFGWTEQELYTLAHHREPGRFLYQDLRGRSLDDPTAAVLKDLRDKSDFLRPFDLIERILTYHNGRHNLLSRLGAEAEDGINALLSQALKYEEQNVPDLTGFLTWMQTEDLVIKRQIDDANDEIRVMTVHGSKGLEAPIVILPDTGKRKAPDAPKLLDMGTAYAWGGNAQTRTQEMAERSKASVERTSDENFRLLYVAMTRAEKWLIVAGAKDKGKWPDSWYSIVEHAMQDMEAKTHSFDLGPGPGLRLEHGDWTNLPQIDVPLPEQAIVDVPPYARMVPDAPVMPPRPLIGSDLGGAKALRGEGQDEETAKTYGSMVHQLLEVLPDHPRDRWEEISARLMTGKDGALAALAEGEAISVLEHPALQYVFAPDTLAEVALTAQINGQTLHGIVDRLIVTDHFIEVIDFKTHRTLPQSADQTPEAILRQMAAYSEGLRQIYPGRDIRVSVLWTASAVLMTIPDTTLREALNRVGVA